MVSNYTKPRLEITTHIGCPINCIDCPQKLLLSKYKGNKTLSLENYKTIIDKVPPNVEIHFSGFCEPFINRNCSDMILYAVNTFHEVGLYTTLQGATIEDYEKLKSVRFNIVTIHIPDKDGKSNFIINEDYLKVLKLFKCDNYSCHGNIDDRVLDSLHYGTNLITFMHDRAGNLDTQQHINIPMNLNIICRRGGLKLNRNVLLPNGDVYQCCMDFGLTGKLGNLLEQSYEELFTNDAYKNIVSNIINNDCICRHCVDALTYTLEEN